MHTNLTFLKAARSPQKKCSPGGMHTPFLELFASFSIKTLDARIIMVKIGLLILKNSNKLYAFKFCCFKINL